MISKVSAYRLPFIASSASTVVVAVVQLLNCQRGATAGCRNFRDFVSRRKNLSFPFSRARPGFPLACETSLSDREKHDRRISDPIFAAARCEESAPLQVNRTIRKITRINNVVCLFLMRRNRDVGRRKRRAPVDAKKPRYRKMDFELRGSLTERSAKLVSMHNDSSAYHKKTNKLQKKKR